MGVCYFYRSIPYLDRRKIAALRKGFWKLIVESETGLGGEESSFEFKYIPDLSRRMTVREDAVVDGKMGKGVERRNAGVFGVAVLVCVGMGWEVWRVWSRGLW